jgi:FtsP/CotA-like multicopper oxidase with cupredoxin domain
LQDPLTTTKPIQVKKPGNPDLTKTVDITGGLNKTNQLAFFVDGSQFRANYDQVLLQSATRNIVDYPTHPEYNVKNYGNAKSVRLILRNYYTIMHTMHLHGHEQFWILAEGMGEWDGKITNPENPQRRDTAQMRMGYPDNPRYLVIQYEADNPGVWPLHCHMTTHTSTGLYMNIVVGCLYSCIRFIREYVTNSFIGTIRSPAISKLRQPHQQHV